MNRTRDFRRHQAEKAKQRARHMMLSWSTFATGDLSDSHLIGRYAITPRPCSCIFCKRPRYNRKARSNKYDGQ